MRDFLVQTGAATLGFLIGAALLGLREAAIRLWKSSD